MNKNKEQINKLSLDNKWTNNWFGFKKDDRSLNRQRDSNCGKTNNMAQNDKI